MKYRGLSIADALAVTVEQATDLFGAVPRIADKLEALRKVGLGYVTLGQPATTLSGGEAQRVEAGARAVAARRRAAGHTLYVFDEPTTGLHFADIEILLTALTDLRDQGNTILVIEHNLDVVACADWVIDLGPEGGEGGGEIVAAGTPEQIVTNERSHTALHLGRPRALHDAAPCGACVTSPGSWARVTAPASRRSIVRRRRRRAAIPFGPSRKAVQMLIAGEAG